MGCRRGIARRNEIIARRSNGFAWKSCGTRTRHDQAFDSPQGEGQRARWHLVGITPSMGSRTHPAEINRLPISIEDGRLTAWRWSSCALTGNCSAQMRSGTWLKYKDRNRWGDNRRGLETSRRAMPKFYWRKLAR